MVSIHSSDCERLQVFFFNVVLIFITMLILYLFASLQIALGARG